MNSKKLCASCCSTAENKSYNDFQTEIEGDRERKIFLTAYIQKTAVASNNPMIIINAVIYGRWGGV
jgi:hypothetical protein